MTEENRIHEIEETAIDGDRLLIEFLKKGKDRDSSNDAFKKLTGIFNTKEGKPIIVDRGVVDLNPSPERISEMETIIENSGLPWVERPVVSTHHICHYEMIEDVAELKTASDKLYRIDSEMKNGIVDSNKCIKLMKLMPSLEEMDLEGESADFDKFFKIYHELTNLYLTLLHGLFSSNVAPDWLRFENIVYREVERISNELELDAKYQNRIKYLDYVPLQENMYIRPDVVVKQGRRFIAVFDAKDKKFGGHGRYDDTRQISEYIHAVGNRPGALVYPRDMNENWDSNLFSNVSQNVYYMSMDRVYPKRSDEDVRRILRYGTGLPPI